MKTSVTKTIVACFLGLLAYLLVLGPASVSQVLNKRADFPGFRAGAELVGTGNLYNAEAVYSRETQIFGTSYPGQPPLRVPAYYLFLKPLTFLSAKGSENLWFSAIVAAMCLVIALQPQGYRAPTAIAFSWCGATLFAILYTQDAIFSTLGLVGFQRLRESKRPAWAGLALAAAILPKPHLVILVPLVLAVTKDWAPLRSCAIGLAVFGLLSFWAEGNWIVPWIRMTTSNEANGSHVEIMPNLHGLAQWVGASSLWEIPATLIVVAVALIAARAPTPGRLAILIALTADLLISRHAYPADCVVLLPFLVTATVEIASKAGRILALWMLSPIPYLLALWGSGYALPLSMCGLLLAIWLGRAGSRRLSQA